MSPASAAIRRALSLWAGGRRGEAQIHNPDVHIVLRGQAGWRNRSKGNRGQSSARDPAGQYRALAGKVGGFNSDRPGVGSLTER